MIKRILSICIPTYNRASSLETLLNILIPQVVALRNLVEVCISNNASTDHTRAVVGSFVKKYPDLIKYSENSENLGFDRNLIKTVDMASGLFVWFFGDDDLIVNNGLSEVVAFIERIDPSKVGLIVLRRECYLIEEHSKRRIVIYDTSDKKMPSYFEMSRGEILSGTFPDESFMSVLIINNILLKNVLEEDCDVVERGFKTYYIHILLYRLVFWKYPHITGYTLNKKIVYHEMPHYRFLIEDEFELLVQGRSALEDILMSTKYAKGYGTLFVRIKRSLRLNFITRLAFMKAFGTFNYRSYTGCLEMFLQNLLFHEGLLFSVCLIVVSLTPAFVLRNALIMSLKRIHRDDWEAQWIFISSVFSLMGKKGRRRLQEP